MELGALAVELGLGAVARVREPARVIPRAMTFWYSSDLPSALMKSHQLTCSHWPKRRSLELVTKTMSRSTK